MTLNKSALLIISVLKIYGDIFDDILTHAATDSCKREINHGFTTAQNNITRAEADLSTYTTLFVFIMVRKM